MGTHQETSTLKTLADAVTETAAAEKAKEGSVGTEGLDVNAAFDGGVAVTGEVGSGGPEFDSGETKENEASLGFEAGEGSNKSGHPNGGESRLEQRSSLDKKEEEEEELADANGSLYPETQMDETHNEGERKKEDLHDDDDGDGDGKACAMETDEGNDDSYEVEYMEDHGYSVGDLVWGKIKSHPWWPGQIYDPSDASDSAMKYNQKDRLLVAYFGDGSFAWCLPSQLIPFAPYFDDMSKQSTSKTFITAVQEAVDEIGRLVELEMTCPCIPEENRNGITKPQAMNAGIKEGVLVPDGEIGKLLSFRYDPVELLAAVANAAESVSFPSMLEISILKGWLSAFYRERGGYVLPVYCMPLPIEGLEDKNRHESEDANDFSVPIEVPIHRPNEEDSFLPVGNGLPATQPDTNHHRRKQKSVAEIMAEGPVAKPKIRKRSDHGEETNGTKKQKLIVEIENHSGISVAAAAQGSKRGRKKKDGISQSGESDSPNGEESSKLGKDRIANPDTGEGVMKEVVAEEISSPRERKKSKYLSPPYTTPHVFKVGNVSSKKEELEKEPSATERKTNRERIGERMTMAAGKVLESSLPGMMVKRKNNDDTVEKKVLKEKTAAGGGAIDVKCSVDKLLSGIQSLAGNPTGRWGGSLDFNTGFFLAFRKSKYAEEIESSDDRDSNGSKRKRLGGKRKSVNSEPEKELGNGKLPVAAGTTGGKKSRKEKSDDDDGSGKEAGSKSIKSTEKKKKADAKSSSSPAPEKGEITDIGTARETLRMMATMLGKWNGKKISKEVISGLNSDIKLLYEKIKKKTGELVKE